MTAIRRREYDSSLNANAAMRTKIKVEDLHIAGRQWIQDQRSRVEVRTVQTESDGLE
jgi:hypothetical protein